MSVSARPESGGWDWKKILGVGVGIAATGALLYFLTAPDARTSLKEADQKFDEATAKKEEEDWEAAEKLFEESLEILRRYLDKNDENISSVYRELSLCALNKLELDKALEYSQECLRIKEHNHGQESEAVCQILVDMAAIYTAHNAPCDAMLLVERAQRIFERPTESERDNAGLSGVLRTKAAVLLKLNQVSEAEEAATKALRCFREATLDGDIHAQYRNALDAHQLLAKIYIKQGNFMRAENVFCDFVQWTKDNFGPMDVYVSCGLRTLGDFYGDRNELDKAETAFQQALTIAQNKYGENDSHVFAFLNHLGHFYCAHGRVSEMQEAFTRLKQMKCLPSPTYTRYLATRLFAFTFTRSHSNPQVLEPVYVGELQPTPRLPADAYLEIFYENPEDPSKPILEERQLTQQDASTITLLSPPVKSVKPRMYEIVIHIYSNKSKSIKLGEHHQLCHSVFDSDKIRTEEDLMAAIPRERMM